MSLQCASPSLPPPSQSTDLPPHADSFTYGILYLLFSAVPLIFTQLHGWTPVQGSLPFLAVLVGTLIAAAINFTYSARVFAPYLDKVRLPLAASPFPLCVAWKRS